VTKQKGKEGGRARGCERSLGRRGSCKTVKRETCLCDRKIIHNAKSQGFDSSRSTGGVQLASASKEQTSRDEKKEKTAIEMPREQVDPWETIRRERGKVKRGEKGGVQIKARKSPPEKKRQIIRDWLGATTTGVSEEKAAKLNRVNSNDNY